MGSQSSKSHEPKNLNNEDANSSVFMKDNASSYQGVKTDTTESHQKSISNGSTTSDRVDKSNDPIQETKVPTLFEWREGGNIVYVTGSFCGWSQFFIMAKNANGVFQLTLELPKGFHQYKFKVDNQWRYSGAFPVINDNGNVNNYVDTTKWESPIKPKQEEKKEDSVKSHHSKLGAKPGRDNYSKNKYLNRTEQNLLSENNSFKQIAKMPHVNLNHLHSKNTSGQNINSVLSSCTSRVRNKFTTIIYYCPNQSSL